MSELTLRLLMFAWCDAVADEGCNGQRWEARFKTQTSPKVLSGRAKGYPSFDCLDCSKKVRSESGVAARNRADPTYSYCILEIVWSNNKREACGATPFTSGTFVTLSEAYQGHSHRFPAARTAEKQVWRVTTNTAQREGDRARQVTAGLGPAK